MATSSIALAYNIAKDRYGELGVDVEEALRRLSTIAISLHCWQGDDVSGFESTGEAIGGGLAVTGAYFGRARNAGELRADLDLAYALIPGKHRLNLHASYAETQGKRVERDALSVDHFQHWIEWAKANGHGIDFNPTLFAHPLTNDGYTLAHRDPAIRRFWVEHCKRTREIAAAVGEALGSPCVNNVWIPDGSKDQPFDRKGPRERLVASLDEIFEARFERSALRDAVEGKLFGLGSEAYVVGSHEFYYGYALKRGVLLCLDSGHFHPTETISDKLSAVLTWLDEILLHVSRGVRWDSDHVVTFSDDLLAIAQELVRGGYLGRVHIGLDFFDASINRISAWVIGSRNLLKALLMALLEPAGHLKQLEEAGDFGSRLACFEELKSFPFGAVWDHYCEIQGVPTGLGWLERVKSYEQTVLMNRK